MNRAESVELTDDDVKAIKALAKEWFYNFVSSLVEITRTSGFSL